MYEKYAKGGSGLIVTGNIPVDHVSLFQKYIFWILENNNIWVIFDKREHLTHFCSMGQVFLTNLKMMKFVYFYLILL